MKNKCTVAENLYCILQKNKSARWTIVTDGGKYPRYPIPARLKNLYLLFTALKGYFRHEMLLVIVKKKKSEINKNIACIKSIPPFEGRIWRRKSSRSWDVLPTMTAAPSDPLNSNYIQNFLVWITLELTFWDVSCLLAIQGMLVTRQPPSSLLITPL